MRSLVAPVGSAPVGSASVALAVVLTVAGAQPIQDPSTTGGDPFAGEGPLANDTFVPVDDEASRRLVEGDRAWSRIAPDSDSGALKRARLDAFESWRTALVESEAGATVTLGEQGHAWSDPRETHARRSECVEYAVCRRLAEVGSEARAAWRERFEPVAREQLDQARAGAQITAAQLATVERRNPATTSGTQAALLLFEHALERGRLLAARNWLQRAGQHLALLDDAAPRLAEGWEHRSRVLDQLGGSVENRVENLEETWRDTSNLELESVVPFRGGRGGGRDTGRLPGRGLVPGLAFLDDGGLVVRTPEVVRYVTPAGDQRPFLPAQIVIELGLKIQPAFTTTRGGWPLDVATDGRQIYFAYGRARGLQGNALLCMRPPEAARAPQLVWALSDQGHVVAGTAGQHGRAGEAGDPEVSAITDLLEPGRWEFQPGALVAGPDLLVQARQWTVEEGRVDESQARTWLLCLDARTGRPRWKRFLAKGADVRLDLGSRFAAAEAFGTSTQPLTLVDGRVFAGTQLGLGALVEVADGRVTWTFRSRRRAGDRRGWSGARPPVLTGPAMKGGAPGLLWAPSDGDHLYWMRATPDLDGNGLLQHAPHPIGEGLDLVGGDPDHALVLSSAGARRTLSSWRATDGRRVDSLYLARDERFAGSGLASSTRALFASDRGLYLLDSTREHYLLDREPLLVPARSARTGILGQSGGRGQRPALGGAVHARGERVYVLGEEALWTFRAAP